MRNKLSVLQNGFRDCAGACLLSIIRYYGGNISKEEISYVIKTNNYGTNAYNLIEGAKSLGFDGYGIKLSFKDFIICNQKLPVIVHTKYSNMYHYIVVYEINKKYIKVMDPTFGIKKISYKEFESIFLETIIILYPVNKIPDIKLKDKIIKKMIDNIFLNKKNIIKIFIYSIIVTFLSIIINLYLKVYIDYVYINFSVKLLIGVMICFLVIILIKNILDNIRTKLLINIKSFVDKDITNHSIDHIMNLPYCHFKNKPSGELINRIEDLDNFKELISNILVNVVINLFFIIISMIILLLINKILFIVTLFIITFYLIIGLIYSYIFKNKIYNIQISQGEYKKDLVETFNSYETIKNLNLMSEFINKVNYKFNKLVNNIKNFEISFSNERSIKNIINEIGIIVLTSFGIYLVYQKILTIGDLVAYSSLLVLFLEPIKELLDLIPKIRYAVSSYEKINDLLIIKKEKSNALDKSNVYGNIEIENLSYSYNNVDYIINNLNFIIKKESKILLYGDSGVGKSTLIKIMLGYLGEYKGSIKIDGMDIKSIEKSCLFNSITYISQKEALFNYNLKDNILCNREIGDKKYNEILKICNVDKIIESRNFKDKFIIEDDGFNLSGGERQKIILARGLLKNSNIIILDEALSEVGLEEEKEIIKKIFKKYEKKIIIYISHNNEIKELFEYKYNFSKKGVENVKQ